MCENGFLAFGSAQNFCDPSNGWRNGIPQLIAGFWGDIDITIDPFDVTFNELTQETANNNDNLFKKSKNHVLQLLNGGFGELTSAFIPTHIFQATWDRVRGNGTGPNVSSL